MTTKNGHQPTEDNLTDYPWRDRSLRDGHEHYESDEPLFRDVNAAKKALTIWQVYNLEVSEVNENEHLKFYNDRAYIVLTIKPKDPKSAPTADIYNLHIWVPKLCSREDYQLAVVRADQLSKKLDEKPFVHREIELHETEAFHDHGKVLEVRRTDEDSSLRLLQFHVEETAHRVNVKTRDSSGQRVKKQWMVERKLLRGNLNTGDVFVLTNLDKNEIFQWNGKKSNDDEKSTAAAFVAGMKAKLKPRRIATLTVNEGENDKNDRIYSLFPTTATKKKLRKSSIKKTEKTKEKSLYRLTDINGRFMAKALEDMTTVSRLSLDTKFVYLLNTDYHVYIWIGDAWPRKKCETCEKCEDQQLMVFFEYADKLLDRREHGWMEDDDENFHQPMNKPITIVNESDDDQCKGFTKALLHI